MPEDDHNSNAPTPEAHSTRESPSRRPNQSALPDSQQPPTPEDDAPAQAPERPREVEDDEVEDDDGSQSSPDGETGAEESATPDPQVRSDEDGPDADSPVDVEEPNSDDSEYCRHDENCEVLRDDATILRRNL